MNLKTILRERGIGTYLALTFSVLTIVLTMILSEVIGMTASARVKSNIGNSLAELALQTADKLDRGMFERYREVQLMARRQDLTSPGNSADAKRAILDERQETFRYYAWIGLTDHGGKVVAATRKMLEGADVSQRPWFREALQGTHVGDVHEAVLLARLLPNPTGEPKRFVDIAFPYADRNGALQGVLGAHLSWQWARDVEQSVMRPLAARRKAEAMIVGRDGTVLLGPDGLQGTKIDYNSVRAARAGGNGFLVEDWRDGRKYLVGYARSSGHDVYPGLGWTILVRQGVEDAYRPVWHIQQRVLWSGVGLAVLFSLLGVAAARRIARPMRELAESAQKIQQGHAVEIRAPHTAYREVRALTGSLNALVTNLLQRRAELKELNQTLEKRVEQRTRELEQALERVSANEKRIQTIIESAQDAFIAVAMNGRVIDWNPAAERMFGWSGEEAIGRPMVELLVPERYRAGVTKSMQATSQAGYIEGMDKRLERTLVTRYGEELAVEVSIGLVAAADGCFFTAFLHDISERKKVEQMKNEFISTVSHELRTPMTSIRASLALLEGGYGGEFAPDTRDLIDIAYRSSERLVRLVNDVLDIEKIESGNMEFDLRPQPLLPIVRQAIDAIRSHAAQSRVAVELDGGDDAIMVMADHDRMIQVVVNLLSNAIKFSPQDAAVKVGITRDAGRAAITVADVGCGIPEAFRSRIFQKFAQADATDSRRKGGTGLGLSICKSIVEQLDGTITFESAPAQGTVFRVELPLADAPPAA